MSSPSSRIAITRQPLLLDPLFLPDIPNPSKPKKPRRKLRLHHVFLSLLSLWACLNVSCILFPPALPCSREAVGIPRWGSPDTGLRPCLMFGDEYEKETTRGVGERRRRRYLMAVVSGGLNQQRNQIVDAVVVARIVGAALVMPVLQVNQVWGDESEFADIFDERHFKETLRGHVAVVSSLPASHLRTRRVSAPPMPFHADEDWIRTNYIPKFSKDNILILRAFNSRLSKNFSADLQKLRCKVAFEALKFQPWIEKMADMLMKRMVEGGPYVALHLRLEKDVWVRTGCFPGLSRESEMEIKKERELNPRFLTSRLKFSAEERYLAGLCPLNGLEISRVLKALGMSKKTRIYWAGGEPFGGKKALEPLQTQFPHLYNKWSLTKPGELDGIKQKPSILAALDYIVCLKSQVFMENHGGNMARALQGHRMFMGYGRHIKPNKKLLVRLFSNKTIEESELQRKIMQSHTDLSGLDSIEKKDVDVVAFPARYCMCSENMSTKTK